MSAPGAYDIRLMIAELRERRVADLSAEEVEALGRLVRDIRTWAIVRHHFENNHRRALEAIDKLARKP